MATAGLAIRWLCAAATRLRKDGTTMMKVNAEELSRVREALRIFPVFAGKVIPPLKVGIIKGIFALEALPADISHAAIRRFLRWATANPKYRQCLVDGGSRYGLDGRPCEEITPEHQADARKRLAVRRNRVKQTTKNPKQTPQSSRAVTVFRRGRKYPNPVTDQDQV